MPCRFIIDYGISQLFLQCLTHNPPALEPCAPPPAKPEALPGARSPGHGGKGRFWKIFPSRRPLGKMSLRAPAYRQTGRAAALVQYVRMGRHAKGKAVPPKSGGRGSLKFPSKRG